MVTAGSFEGGDFMIVEPGVAAIGTGEERTQEQAARQVAGWLEAEGWEVRVERIPPHFLHIDVLACMLGEKLAAVCVEQASNGFVSWLESKGVEIVPVTARRRAQARRERRGARRRPGALHRRVEGPQRAPARARPDRLRPRALARSRSAAAAPTA